MFTLRIRTNTAHNNLCDVWIVGQEGATEFGLMHGTMSEVHAELLAERLGLDVERRVQSLFVEGGAVEHGAVLTAERGKGE